MWTGLTRSGTDKALPLTDKEIPVYRAPLGVGSFKLVWKTPLLTLDLDHHLPRLADLVREGGDRAHLAEDALLDAFEACSPDRVCSVIPGIVTSLRGNATGGCCRRCPAVWVGRHIVRH